MSEDTIDSVVWMVRGAWLTMLLRSACRLGVFEVLGEPLTSPEVAASTGTDPSALARLLRALTVVGVVERDGDRFGNARAGTMLREGHPSHLRDLVLVQSDLHNLAAWHALDDAVRTGEGVYRRVNGVSNWEHRAADPDLQRSFNASMSRRAGDQVRALLGAVDLAGSRTVVDVGGGRGGMVAGLLRAVPGLSGVVADQPDMVAEAEAAFAEAGLSDRGRGVVCDFFASVPQGGDVYTLSNVLHDWVDADCVRILRGVRAAMEPGARLLVVEKVLDAPGRSFESERDLQLLDLHMLVMFGACERTEAEYGVLLTAAGFTAEPLNHTGTDWNVIEARPTT
jgi:O-methyltransferase domain/Dimerisation domain